MKKRLKVIIGLCIVLLLLGMVFTKVNTIPKLEIAAPGEELPENIQFQFDIEKIDIIEEDYFPLYQYSVKNIDRTEAENIYRNITGEKIKGSFIDEKDRFTITEEKDNFWIDKETGRFGYSKHNLLYSEFVNGDENSNTLKTLPDIIEAVSAAESFLSEINLLPQDFQYYTVQYNYTEKSGVEIPMNLSVTFSRKVNGFHVYGVSRIVVTVGHEGEIEQVLKLYNDLEKEKVKDIRIKSVEEAFNDVLETNASISFENVPLKDCYVNKVELAYYEDSQPLGNQLFLQPVFVFWGDAKEGNLEGKWNAIVPAAKESFFIK